MTQANENTQTDIQIPTLESTYKGRKFDPSHNMHGMDEWACKLVYNGKKFSFPFFMGKGHNKRQPELYDVLNSLFLDAFAGQEHETLKDFMDTFGYEEEDARKAKKVFKDCQAIFQSMTRLFQVDAEGLEALAEQYRQMELID